VAVNRVTPGPLLVRALVPAGAAVVLLAGGRVVGVPAVVLVVGVALAVARPARLGSWVAIGAAAWSFAAATTADVAEGRAVLAALGVYLLHTGTAAAAACPLGARVSGAVARRWLLRCLPAVVLTAVVVGLDSALGSTPDNPLFLTAVALVVVVAVVSLVRLLAATRDP
jgi:hypothetical protein